MYHDTNMIESYILNLMGTLSKKKCIKIWSKVSENEEEGDRRMGRREREREE